MLEDLHWSDESTLEFLHFFTRKTASHRLLLVLTYRSDEVHQPLRSLLAHFDRERQRQEVILSRLSRANTETFLQTILQGTRSLPTGMLDALFDLTEGNPFFLEELLKALIVGNWSRKRTAGAGNVQIPGTSHSVCTMPLSCVSRT